MYPIGSRVSVRIRPAQHADIDGLVDLIGTTDTKSGLFSGRALLDPSPGHLAERLGEILDEGIRSILVAVDGDTVVGMLVARPDDVGAIDVTRALHVTHLMVAPAHRRRGAGRALLAGAVHLADDLGVDRVVTTAGAGSREANRYLARLGFAPLVVDRIASTTALRRTLGMVDRSDRIAVLRRSRLAGVHPGRVTARVVGRRA